MKTVRYLTLALALFFGYNVANAQNHSFTTSVGYTNQTLNHSDKNTMISVGFSYHLPICDGLVSADYGFEAAKSHRKGTSFGANLSIPIWEGVWDDEIIFKLSIGARYQYDRIFFDNSPRIKSNSVGPLARLTILQYFIETGYLWGVNDVDLQLNDKGKMNGFFLKVGTSIPLKENITNRKIKELSKKEKF